MATDDAVRSSLHRQLEEDYGPAEAALLMTGVLPFPWTEVATKRDLDLLGREMRGELREVRGELLEVRGEIREVRGELLARIGGQGWKIVVANVASSAAVAGAVVAAVRL